MDDAKKLELLYRYASTCKFDDFTELFESLAASSSDPFREACLMRAQIKLFAADATLMDDLEIAGPPGVPAFPCLKDAWEPDSPNRFVVFQKTPGAVQNFLEVLPQVESQLESWYGVAGLCMARQVRCEVLYYYAMHGDVLRLAGEMRGREEIRPVDDTLLHYVLFRSYLATGRHDDAERCMLEMIRMTKSHPECVVPYQTVRDWANLTTGWSGDTPRFFEVPHGESLPLLEDRLAAIRSGISRLTLSEEPFAEYAQKIYCDACTMRQHFMDIFHAIYWFQTEDTEQAEVYFQRAYDVAVGCGFVMPFAEYGKQIVPLLEYIEKSDAACSREWTARLRALAGGYEEALDSYRS